MALPQNPAPPQINDLIGDLVTALAPHLPAMMEQLADLFGRTAPKTSGQDRQRLMVHLKRKMRLLIPAFTDLESMRALPDSAEKWNRVKAALRGVLIEMLAPPRIRRSPEADRLDWLVAMAAKRTDLPRAAWARQPSYLSARECLWNVLIGIYSRVPSAAVQDVIEAWVGDNDFRRYVHSLRLLTVAAARFRPEPPKRITDRASLELQNEYTRSANLFEQQLRLLACLTRTGLGTAKPWSYWQGQNLKNLMEMSSKSDELSKLVAFINRNVRNALTHGPPIVERAARRCQFCDRNTCVTWNWEDYFHNTRALTLTVLGCANLDSFRQLIEVQILAKALAAAP